MLLLAGFITAFWLYSNSCRPHCPYTFNQISVGTYIIHLHHWLLSLIAIPFTTVTFIRGLLYGGVVHGILMYDDWLSIVRVRPDPQVTDPLLSGRDGFTSM
jgi:hypothetical protein